MSRCTLKLFCLAVSLVSAASAYAQYGSSTGSGGFGSSQGSFGLSGGGGFGVSNNGGGGGFSGNGGFGAGGMGGGGFGTGQQGGLQQGGLQQGGLQQGPGGTQGGFVGSDPQDVQNIFQNMRGGNRRQALFNVALQSLNELRDSRRDRRNRRRQPPPARVTLMPEIDVAPLTAVETASNLGMRFESLASAGGQNVAVSMEGRTAVLTGAVSTEHEKALAEKLASIEPGVSEVRNQITVQSGEDQ